MNDVTQALEDIDIAKLFHDAYEKNAKRLGYKTRKESAVDWDDVPELNKLVMVATVGDVRQALEKMQCNPTPPSKEEE